MASNSQYDWKKIAFACRDVLIDFSEAIYKPEYLPSGEKVPTRDQTKNKIRITLLAKLGNSKTEERRLIETQIEYSDRLIDFVNKHLHQYASKGDAQKCIIYTYLTISDILKLIEKNPTETKT